MRDKLFFYDRLSPEDAERFEKIDDFLKLSERFSPKGVRRRKLLGVVSILFVAVMIIVVCVVQNDKGSTMLALCFTPVLGLLIYKTWCNYNNTYHPEVERAITIVIKDGMDAVFDDFINSRSIAASNVYTGGRYLFVKGKSMCRIENTGMVYPKYVSRGRGGSYYACTQVTDETGIYDLKLKELRGFGSPQRQCEEMKNAIAFYRITSGINKEEQL